MGLSMTQKILAAAMDQEAAAPGELIFPVPSLFYGTEHTLPQAAKMLNAMDISELTEPGKTAAIATGNVAVESGQFATLERAMAEFVRKYGIEHFYPAGRGGVAPFRLAEAGLTVPGEFIIGGDVHAAALGALGIVSIPVGSTDLAVALALNKFWMHVPQAIRVIFHGEPGRMVSGKDLGLAMMRQIPPDRTGGCSMEFGGEALTELSIADRFTVTEMAIDAGGLNGIMIPDEKMLEYLADYTSREAEYYFADDDVEYAGEYEIDVDVLTPMVHELGRESKIYSVGAVEEEIPVHQVVIGGCSGGLLEDLWTVAKVMKYRQIPEHLRLHIIPATITVYRQMINGGLASIFSELGATIWPPSCGLCPDSRFHGVAPGDNVVVTTRGRRLGPNNRVWSTSPAVAAATAVTGHLIDPREIVPESDEGETPPDVNIQEFMSG